MSGQDRVQEIIISPLGWAVMICPQCGLKSHTKPGKEMLHVVLERTCSCGARHKIIFDTRSEPRKKCSLPGILFAEEDITVEIINICEKGASFEADELRLDIDGIYRLKIKINDKWSELLIKIIRIDKNVAGFEFVNPGFKERKIIESYLLAD